MRSRDESTQVYEAASSFNGKKIHAMPRARAKSCRGFGQPDTAASLCGISADPIVSDFDQNSAYACGNCLRVIARSGGQSDEVNIPAIR